MKSHKLVAERKKHWKPFKYSSQDVYCKYQKRNILTEFKDVCKVTSSTPNKKLRSCDKKLFDMDRDLLVGQIDAQYEFRLKLCYCEKLSNKNADGVYKEFLKENSQFLLLQIQKEFLKFVDDLFSKPIHQRKTLNWLITAIRNKEYRDFDWSHESCNNDDYCDPEFYDNECWYDQVYCDNEYCEKDYDEKYYDDDDELSNYDENFYDDGYNCDKDYNDQDNCDTNNFYGNYLSEVTEYFITTPNKIRLKELWIDKLESKVKEIKFSNEIRKKGKAVPYENKKQCFEFVAELNSENFVGKLEEEVNDNQLKADYIEYHFTAILLLEEMRKVSKLSELLVLLMILLIVGTSDGHHKSAKLKKYLTLKYEYDKAILYLLWCSGDIEVHPGPCLKKKSLVYDSSKERRWIQNLSPKLIIRLPEHLKSKYNATKKTKNDEEDRENFKLLLKTCEEETVHVPKMYLSEINTWETREYKLLYKLFIYRCETETVRSSIIGLLTCGCDTKALTKINVTLISELETNEIARRQAEYRHKCKSQMMIYFTRHIAGITIKCAHGKDPDEKCDGLWDLPLTNWPKDITLFDPNNRGKYSKKSPGQKLIPDQELVDMLLALPQVTIPKKYKDIVDAFRTMRKSQKDKSINKQHKAELCTTFKRITSLEKLDYALNNLWESGIFTEEVHNNLNKWWTTGAVDTTGDKNVSPVDIYDAGGKERPHILINISTKSITLTVKQTGANSSQVRYDFPFKDELVPLKTMTTTVCQATIRKPSSDSHQKVTADNQTYSITIPPYAMTVLNSYFPCDLYPNSHAISERDIKHQHKMSSQETALCSRIYFNQLTSSTNQFSKFSQNVTISGKPGTLLCTSYQSTTNSDDISSATKDSQNLDFYMQVSPTSDMGSSDSISSITSESRVDEGDQNNMLNGGQVLLSDSDYSLDSSNNCILKTNMKKRKCMEEDRNEMKKRKIPSLKQNKKPKETKHRKMDSSIDRSTIFNTNMELLQDSLQIDLDSFVFDDQTFDVKLNALNNEDKNTQICDKDGNLMNGETQMSNENTNISAYNTGVSTILENFVQDMINKEHEKMSQMK
ncbi:uncharacterized protein LOC143061927 [Mytilus galloprovincialis]|uniref:uncharacterized protein LOC143061927 n=1 Tax=Mytilus galloprovincialis TaxID=29158 RepID=UPI003F7BB9DA